MKKFVSSWSGGKDSCYALMQAISGGMQPGVLLNMMNEDGILSRSHAIPEHILVQQAAALGLPLVTAKAGWANYESVFINKLKDVIRDYGVDTAVFGDIDLQAHRDWEEKVCQVAGIEAQLPLWQQNRKALVLEMLQQPIQTFIVSCNEIMGKHFLGRLIDTSLIKELEAIGVDACGENGEYHTLVVNCPLFTQKIEVQFDKKYKQGDYWFIEIK